MLIDKKLLKDIPRNKKEIILKKMFYFEQQLLKNKSYIEMAKGFWTRKIEGTDIFKFRVNNGDRILFCYKNIQQKHTVVFLRYRNHDEQIKTAKNVTTENIDFTECDFDINMKEYIEDNVDSSLSEYAQSYVGLNTTVNIEELQAIVLEDEYIALLLDENDENYLYYLSEEQFDCLKILHRPVFIGGCAGSGKSMIGIRKILLNNKEGINSAYITYSPNLKNKSLEFFNKYGDTEKNNTSFYTINELCLQLLSEKENNLVMLSDFKNWFYNNYYYRKNINKLTIEEIWLEINGIIKGYCGENWSKKSILLSKDEYIRCNLSSLNNEDKNKIYSIAVSYQSWLDKNGLKDENDLAFELLTWAKDNKVKKFDFIFLDEMQDMTGMQLLLIFNLVKDSSNLMFTGDIHQVIRLNYFDIGSLKKLFFMHNKFVEETFLKKNFRNSQGISLIANKVLEIKRQYFGSKGQLYEQKESIIRNGKAPFTFNCSNQDLTDFFKKVDMNNDAAIVVSNEEIKVQLGKSGYPMGRMFTVEEIKGLDYKTVICYNLLSDNSYYWDKLFSNNIKKRNIIEKKVNLLYVALTRARNILCLIENGNNLMLQNFNGLCEVLSSVDLKKLGIEECFVVENWLREAIRLEKAELYHQAVDAYKKANMIDDALRCEQIIKNKERKLSNIAWYTIITIKSDKGNLSYHLIKRALQEICSTYNVRLDCFVKLYTYPSYDEAVSMFDYGEDINTDTIHKLSQIIEDVLKKKSSLNKNKITIHACLLKNNIPVDLSDILMQDYDTLLINCSKNNCITIKPLKTKSNNEKLSTRLHYEREITRLFMDESGLNKVDKVFFQKHKDEYIKANELLNHKRYEDALPIFEKLIKITNVSEETLSKIYLGLCSCYIGSQEYDKAKKYGNLSIKYNLQNYDAYFNLGVAYLNCGEYEESIQCYEKAMKGNAWAMQAKKAIEQAKTYIEYKQKSGITKRTLSSEEFNKLRNKILQTIEKGEIKIALEIIENSMKKYNISNSLISSYYGCIAGYYYKKNDIDFTVKYIIKSINIDSNNELAKRAYKQITGENYIVS